MYEVAEAILPEKTTEEWLRILPTPRMSGCSGVNIFQEAVRKLPGGPDVPHLDQAFILKCLDDMRRLGVISAPAMTIAAE